MNFVALLQLENSFLQQRKQFYLSDKKKKKSSEDWIRIRGFCLFQDDFHFFIFLTNQKKKQKL